ncbi:MAG: hypothetical protein OQK12_19465 [Motiliproteus sp.]|nr:hypothetical protein [Motiliproteus sp.]MCW9053836.1 hypothetical protein [Motiliproteus sp.]
MTAKINSSLNYHPHQTGDEFSETVRKIEKGHRPKEHLAGVVVVFAAGFLLSALGLFAWAEDKTDVQGLVGPSAILLSATVALYLTLVQLHKKEQRDRVEHAVDVCEKAPDLMDVEAAVVSLQQHVKTVYKQTQADTGIDAPKDHFEGVGEWEKAIRMLEFIADNQPASLGSLYDSFEKQYPRFNASLAKAMAFFEKSAIGIELGHADDTVIWRRFNVAALKYWVKGYPYILRTWYRHSQSKHLIDAKELGFPYDHYEAWLRHHCEDKDLQKMLGRFHSIRMKMLKALD